MGGHRPVPSRAPTSTSTARAVLDLTLMVCGFAVAFYGLAIVSVFVIVLGLAMVGGPVMATSERMLRDSAPTRERTKSSTPDPFIDGLADAMCSPLRADDIDERETQLADAAVGARRQSWRPWIAHDGIFTTCPKCGLPGHHVLEWRETPGVHATWPDPMAPHWWRQCLTCRHEWDEHEESA